MGSLLGFRSPQFSEDGAWLPCWLQQEDSDGETFVQGLEQGKSSPERCVEGHHNCQKHIHNISADQYLGEEGRYTNCHLYLSGDDSSLPTVTSSIDNVTQFQLHLSLDCSSVGMPSPCIDAFHVERNEIYSDQHVQHSEVSEPKVNNVLNAEQKIDAIVCSLVPECRRTENDKIMKELDEKSRSLEVEEMRDSVVASQLIVDHNVPNCSLAPECDRAPEDQCLDGLDEYNMLIELEQADDAVEMSISASEALVIHEVLRTLSSELPVSSVLEAALQLKQARLEVWKDSHETCCNPLEEEITDSKVHSDSEGIHKEDVYDHIEGDNLSVSQVKDTLDSENCGQDRKSKLVSTSTSHYDHLQGYNLSVSQVKDTLDSESCGHNRNSKTVAVQLPNTERNLHSDDFTNRKMEEVNENDHQLQQNTVGSYDCDVHNKSTMGLRSTSMSHHSNYMLHSLGQTEEHNSTEDCSLQANLECPRAKRFEIDGQHYGVSGTVCNRFQSRWFGGWSGNDTNISVPMRPNNIEIIAGHFAGETSYLSESADIAPDENSFVGPKPDEKASIASQSTIPSEGTFMNGNNQVHLSQDASRFSSPSYVDPLCSVVPCSIQSQNMLCRSALCDDKQVNSEKFIPGTEHIENLQSSSNLDNKVLSEQFSVSEASADRPEHSVHKRMISMRSISVLPCYVSSLKNESHGKTCLLGKSVPPPNLYGSTESEHEFPSGLQREMNSHFTSMTKGSVQHLDHFSSDFSAEANGKQIEGSQALAGIPTHPNLLKLQLLHENQNIASSGTIKRVRFAEIETKVPHREKQLKQQITSNTCHTVRASKCLRLSRANFESRAQNKKGTLTNCQANFVKTLLFQSMKFLLTGFTKQMLKRIEELIRKYGGTVLTDIPIENKRKRSSRHREQALPVVLCPKKLQTMKFLYGCAVGALMVKAKWLTDSIAASSLLPPEQYMILRKSFGGSLQTDILLKGSNNYIFDGVGIMLHGSKRNCSRIAKVIEHGGGRVFKTLQKLVLSLDAAKITLGFIVTEDGSWTSRHLKQCALEKKIPIMSVQWIVKSLHAQKLLPFTEKKDTVSLPLIRLPDTCSIGWSQEI